MTKITQAQQKVLDRMRAGEVLEATHVFGSGSSRYWLGPVGGLQSRINSGTIEALEKAKLIKCGPRIENSHTYSLIDVHLYSLVEDAP